MKKYILLIVLFSVSIFMVRGETPRVEPSFWWSGMAENELQLMVSGDNIADYVPAVTSKHVSIREVVTLENRNYQLIYLDLTEAVPESFDLVFTNGKKKITVPYELKERNPERLSIESCRPQRPQCTARW